MKNSDSFLRSGHWPTLLSAFLYFDVSFMVWVLLGALGNYIGGEFQLAPAQKGLMTAIPLLGGSIMRLVFGKLTDWLGPRRTGCIGLALTFVPLLGGCYWELPARASRSRCRWPAGGTRRGIKAWRWGSRAPATPAHWSPLSAPRDWQSISDGMPCSVWP
jgi:hypothetical protein